MYPVGFYAVVQRLFNYTQCRRHRRHALPSLDAGIASSLKASVYYAGFALLVIARLLA